MNAERLYAIALAVQQDLRQTNVVASLGKLTSGLQNLVNSPQEPSHQQAVSNTIATIRNNLSAAPSNAFPPIWLEVLDATGMRPLMGTLLLAQIDEIFLRNQITPSVAMGEIRAIQQRAEQLQAALQGLVASFEGLRIPAETLAAGEVEVGILIPRAAVENRLEEFGLELTKLNRLLGTFAEVATGQREGFSIRAIASSELAVFLAIAPTVGACLAVAIERTVALYRQLLEIKKLRREMQSQGVPAEALAPIEQHANTLIETGIEPIVESLLDQFWKSNDKHRRAELKIELRASLNSIANRVDLGYNFEVRTAPPTSDQPAAGDDTTEQHLAAIRHAAGSMQFVRQSGEPILRLPEASEPAASSDEPKPKGKK